MKHFGILVLLMSVSCEILEPGRFSNAPSPGISRGDNNPETEHRVPWEGYPFQSGDTTLCFSTVYRDSLKQEICFYKDWDKVLSLTVGGERPFSADEDLHHIIGGHFYTEYNKEGLTVICKDGEEFLRLSTRELMLGLLEKGQDCLCLTKNVGGNGFVLRKNGRIILERDNGTVFGDLQDPSYYPNGALYEDCGHYYFSYKLSDNEYYVVEDGREQEVFFFNTAYPLQDIKVRDAEAAAASWRRNYFSWTDSHLWHNGNEFVQTGDIEVKDGLFLSSAARFNRSYNEVLTASGATLYYNGNTSLHGVLPDGRGGIYLLETGLPAAEAKLEGRYKFFDPRCARLLDDGLIVALNPTDGLPFIYYQGKKWYVSWMNGEITSMECIIKNK